MMNQKMTTPADILKEREEMRASGRIAHSANSYGEMWARVGCPCYACRDQLDPTGEEDAQQRNVPLLPAPSSPVLLHRQNAICICCSSHHSNSDSCALPPPPPAIRLPALGPSSSSAFSPLVGIISPRSLSDSSSAPEEKYVGVEKQIIPRLKRLLATYEQAQINIEEKSKDASLHHDEMAANDAWLSDIDTKMLLVENLLKALMK